MKHNAAQPPQTPTTDAPARPTDALSDGAVISGLLLGLSVTEIAKKNKVSRSTVTRRMTRAVFRARLEAARDDLIRQAADLFLSHLSEAANALVKVLKDAATPPAVVVQAARAILDGLGKTRALVPEEARRATPDASDPAQAVEAVEQAVYRQALAGDVRAAALWLAAMAADRWGRAAQNGDGEDAGQAAALGLIVQRMQERVAQLPAPATIDPGASRDGRPT